MKKANSLIALILALSFITPSLALTACETDDSLQTPPPALSAPSVDEEEPSDSANPDAPTPPTTPSEPTTPPQTDNSDNSTVVKPVVQNAQYIKATGNSVNLRSGAGTSYAVLGQVHAGESYAVLGKTGNWYKIYYKNQTAYLYADYGAVFTVQKSKNQEVESVISEGYKLLGIPYVYGAVRLHDGNGKLLKGFTAQKFDCSSLIQYIFYKGADELLQVTTRTQVKQGEFVAKKDLQRGDCMFFTNESRQHLTGVERVGHVALYLGDNYILHTASDYAVIEPISTTRWNYLLDIKRHV